MGKYSQIMQKIGTFMHKNSPAIFTALGVTGVITTTALAIEITPAASDVLDEIKDANGEITPKDYLMVTRDFYIPTIASGVATIGCIIAAHTISSKRTAAIATAYSIAEASLTQYQSALVQELGEDTAKKIAERVAENKMNEHPVVEEDIISTENGVSLCFDPYSGRYFRSSYNELMRAQNDLNYILVAEQFVPLNTLYDLLGLEPLAEVTGEELGWSSVRGLVEFNLTAKPAPNGEPCLVLDFLVGPEYDFRHIY